MKYEAMNYETVMERLKSLSDPKTLAGMARFGVTAAHAYGIPTPHLRNLAKQIGKDHALALQLWDSGIHEARIVASLIAEPVQLTEPEMERWVTALDSWDVCDQCCSNLFDKTPFAYQKALEWSTRNEEYVKRAGFVLMAVLAVHDKKEPDERFIQFFPMIRREATDSRNFVKKAVNWALRQIGKRNQVLNRLALETAREIQTMDSPAARWIAGDAIRELTPRPGDRDLYWMRRMKEN